jgi:hypothetical protein
MASGKKKNEHNDQSDHAKIKSDLAIVNRVTFVSCCTYQWAKDKTCPIKGCFRASVKTGFHRVDHVAARQIGVNRGSALRGNARNSGFFTPPPPPPRVLYQRLKSIAQKWLLQEGPWKKRRKKLSPD